MDSIKEIDRKIELLRSQLQKLAEEKQYDFLNEEVTQLSEQLDILIVRRERCKIIEDI